MSLTVTKPSSEFEKDVFKRRTSLDGFSEIKELIQKEFKPEENRSKILSLEKKLTKALNKIHTLEKNQKSILDKIKEKVSVEEVQFALNEMQKKLKEYVDDNNQDIKTNFLQLKENLNSKIKQSALKIKNEVNKAHDSQPNSARNVPFDKRRNSRLSRIYVEKSIAQNPTSFLNDVLNEVYNLREENHFLKTLINTKYARKGKYYH